MSPRLSFIAFVLTLVSTSLTAGVAHALDGTLVTIERESDRSRRELELERHAIPPVTGVTASELAMAMRTHIGKRRSFLDGDVREDVMKVIGRSAWDARASANACAVVAHDRAVDFARVMEMRMNTSEMHAIEMENANARAIVEAIVEAGDVDVAEAFSRVDCFDGIEARVGGIDARERAMAYVLNELECFERAFAKLGEGGEEGDGKGERRCVVVSLEGVGYVAKKFGAKSDLAAWSARKTEDSLSRAFEAFVSGTGRSRSIVVLAIANDGARERSSAATLRRLLGFDRRLLDDTSNANANENDEEAVKEFQRRVVQWVVTIIIVAAAVGGVLALFGMPLYEDALLYAPIPGIKLD